MKLFSVAISVVALLAVGCAGSQPADEARDRERPEPTVEADPVVLPAALRSAQTSEIAPSPSDAIRSIVGAAWTASVRNGLAFLRVDGDRWMRGEVGIQDGKGCVSCHHVGYALWAHREAQRRSLVPADPRMDDLQSRAQAFLLKPGKLRPVMASEILMTQEGGLQDFAAYLADSAEADGHWRARGQFPDQNRSEAESDSTATLWALLALTRTGQRESERFADRIEKSRLRGLEWIRSGAEGESIEWKAARVTVEQSVGNSKEAGRRLKELLAMQNPDGGWGWEPGGESNAFSTGQAIYAIAGFKERDAVAAIELGGRFLLRTQQTDGTWIVPSHLTSAEPTAAKDEIYRFWGTAWAVLGLSRGHDRIRDDDSTTKAAL